MEIISSNWIRKIGRKLECCWPNSFNNQKMYMQALNSHYVLTEREEETCSRSRIYIKYQNENYQKTNQKLRFLRSQSSVEDSDSNNNRGKGQRKITPKHFSGMEYNLPTSSDDKGPLLPKLKSFSTTKKDSNVVTSRTSTPKSIIHEKSISRSTTPSVLSESLSKTISGESSKSKSPALEEFDTGYDESTLVEKASVVCSKNKVLMEKMLKSQEEMKYSLNYLITLVQNMTQENDNSKKSYPSTAWVSIESSQDLSEFNENLGDKNYFASMVQVFRSVGGANSSDTVKRILAKIITNDVAKKYNWTGQNKENFQCLKNILDLILVASRKNLLSKDTPYNDVESVTKVWLRGAGYREGGRSRRSKKSSSNVNTE